MTIRKQELSRMFLKAADYLEQAAGELGEIDSRFGDGDHGVTMQKIAGLLRRETEAWEHWDIKEFIELVGSGIMAIGGGSAGPLYGTLIGGLALELDEEREILPETLKKMLSCALGEMEDITTARLGDKTMMDALIPAVEAALACGGDCLEILEAAARAAEKGAETTKDYVSKFGRAKSYKEETLGTMDAGAKSTALLFRGFADGLK